MKTVVVICALFCALITASAATNVTVLSTLAHPETGYQGIGDLSGQSLQSTTAFKTDDTPGQLVSVLLRFFDAYIPSNAPGPFQLSICSDGGNKPGAILPAIFSGKTFPTNAGDYTYTNTSPLTLLPNTTYWLVISSPGSVGSGANYRWVEGPDTIPDPGSFWSLGSNGVQIAANPWTIFPGHAPLYSIKVLPLPPPLTLSAGVGAQTNFAAISNLGQSTSSSAAVGPASPTAISFVTGSREALLNTVSVSMQIPQPAPGSFQPFSLSIYDDSGGSPGTSLAVLTGNSYPTNTGVYGYTNTPPLKLAANSRYWIVASAAPASRSYSWSLDTSGSVDSGSAWTLGVMEANFGSGWAVESGFFPKFSLTASTPTFVLSFPTPDFPYLLRQNAAVTPSNWVIVTNLLSSSIVSNRTVLTVPPLGSQQFYRLDIQ